MNGCLLARVPFGGGPRKNSVSQDKAWQCARFGLPSPQQHRPTLTGLNPQKSTVCWDNADLAATSANVERPISRMVRLNKTCSSACFCCKGGTYFGVPHAVCFCSVISNPACNAVMPVPGRANLLPPPAQQPPRIVGGGGRRFGVEGGGVRDLRPFRILQKQPAQGKKVPRLDPFISTTPTLLGTSYLELVE